MNIANKLSLFRIILVPLFIISILIFQTYNLIPFLIFVIAALTDFLDGYLARKYNLVTTFGKFIDPIADKILTLSAFIMLLSLGKIPGWAVCIIVSREITITGFRTIAASAGVTISASNFGKFKTISQFASIILLLINLDRIGLIVFYIAVIFTILSGIDYIYKNYKILDLENI